MWKLFLRLLSQKCFRSRLDILDAKIGSWAFRFMAMAQISSAGMAKSLVIYTNVFFKDSDICSFTSPCCLGQYNFMVSNLSPFLCSAFKGDFPKLLYVLLRTLLLYVPWPTYKGNLNPQDFLHTIQIHSEEGKGQRKKALPLSGAYTTPSIPQ